MALRSIALFLIAYALSGCQKYDPSIFKEGDIIFQTSTSSQSEAIQRATHSQYSHMGVLVRDGSGLYVLEAVQPVKLTPISKWIERGKSHHFVVKRLRDAKRTLTEVALSRFREVGKKYLGKNYDPYFEWSDDRLYCSELVWKIYKHAFGIELGNLQRGSDFDFSDPVVKAKMRERFPKGFPPGEIVISPEQMLRSSVLETVHQE